jgi:soluble lytic murein transglycosylase-like protein
VVKYFVPLLALAMLFPTPATATVIIVGEDGNTIIHEATDYLSEQRRKNIAPRFIGQTVSWPERRKQYEVMITNAAEKYALPASLLHAIILTESAYNAEAVSPAGAQGLMQLMPDTAIRFGVSDVFDPVQNIDGGSRYVK